MNYFKALKDVSDALAKCPIHTKQPWLIVVHNKKISLIREVNVQPEDEILIRLKRWERAAGLTDCQWSSIESKIRKLIQEKNL